MKYNFIIPYRNREEHLRIFKERFEGFNLNDDYQFYFIHQADDKPFNRGAIKNIGYLIAKEITPDALFIFHDIDTLPTYWGGIDYDTPSGSARRPVGSYHHFENLGTICCFYGSEFEKINGFPNYWGWGAEDITLIHRVKKFNIPINIENMAVFHTNRCQRFDHSRNDCNMDQNGAICQKEIDDGNNFNGLSTLKFEFVKEEIIGKNMKMIHIKLNDM
jgi:hypothetical protein